MTVERRGGRPALIAVAGLTLVVGAVLRVWILRSPLGAVNADEAVSGLMARALLDGDVTTFYWQQHYGGTIELVPLAVLVATIGDSAALAVLPLLEAAAIGVLLYLLARRRLGGPLGLATAALAAVFPASAVWMTTRAMLFYQPTMLLGLGALVMADQLGEDDLTRRQRLVRWFVLGVLLGAGWWTSSQIVFYAVPAIGWILLRRRVDDVTEVLAGAAGAIVGAVPWILHNVRTALASLREVPGGPGGYVDHLRAQVEAGWPMSFGLRRPFDEDWIVDGWGWPLALVAVVGVAAVTVAFVRHRHLRCPLAMVLLVFPLVHALAPSSSYVGTGRYYVFLGPSIAYAVVAALSVVAHGRRWVTGALVVAAALTTWTLVDLRHVRPGPSGIEELNASLTALGVDHAYTDYWTGYMMAWEDDGMVVSPDIFDRRPDWSSEVREAPRVAYVFAMRSPLDRRRHDDLVPRLAAEVGVEQSFDVGNFRVVVPERNVPPEALPALDAAD